MPTNARRPKGEGSVYQRKDGRWVAAVRVTDPQTGERRTRYLYAPTLKEAQQKRRAALIAAEQGNPVTPERQTVRRYLEGWLEDVVRPTVAVTTYNSYVQAVRLHITPALGSHPIGLLSAQHVRHYRNSRLKEAAPVTVHKEMVMLRMALKAALRDGLLTRNVALLVDMPRKSLREIHPLTPEQSQQLITSVKDTRLEALYVLALTTGLRKGEVLGLQWEDIDWQAGTLTVRHSLQFTGQGLELLPPKTAASRRTILLPRLALLSLKAHQRDQREERMASPQWQHPSYVFATRTGRPLHPGSFNVYFTRVLKRAGLPHIRFHDLRHTAATLMLGPQRINIRTVSEVLGHADISTTLRIYAHVLDSMRQEVADKMDEMFVV